MDIKKGDILLVSGFTINGKVDIEYEVISLCKDRNACLCKAVDVVIYNKVDDAKNRIIQIDKNVRMK